MLYDELLKIVQDRNRGANRQFRTRSDVVAWLIRFQGYVTREDWYNINRLRNDKVIR